MNNGTIRIGHCVLDLADNQLRAASGREVHLPHKAARVLHALASHQGELVSREFFVDTIWDGNYLIGPNRLNDEIWKIRRALGTCGAGSIQVKTIPRKGYCLLVEQSSVPEATDADLNRKQLRHRNPLRMPVTLARAAMAATAAAGLLTLLQAFDPETAASPVKLTGKPASTAPATTEPTENESDLISFLLNLLDHGVNSPDAAQAVVVSSLLAEAEARASDAHHDPVIQARIMSGLADIHFRQGNYQRARELLERTVAQAAKVYGADSQQFMRARISLARVMSQSGFTEAATQLYADALTRIGHFQDVENDLVLILNGLGLIELRKGNLGAAEQHFLAAIDVSESAPDSDLGLADSLVHLAIVYRESFRFEEALARLQQAQRYRQQVEDHRPHPAGFNLARQADVLLQLDRPAEARDLAQQALETFTGTTPIHQMGRAISQVSLAKALLQLDQLEPASTNLLEGIELLKQQEPARAMMPLAFATNVLGDLEDRLGERQKAEYYYRLSIAGFQKLLGRSHPRTQAALNRFREYAALN